MMVIQLLKCILKKITYPVSCRITRETSYCDKFWIGINQKLNSICKLEENGY